MVTEKERVYLLVIEWVFGQDPLGGREVLWEEVGLVGILPRQGIVDIVLADALAPLAPHGGGRPGNPLSSGETPTRLGDVRYPPRCQVGVRGIPFGDLGPGGVLGHLGSGDEG